MKAKRNLIDILLFLHLIDKDIYSYLVYMYCNNLKRKMFFFLFCLIFIKLKLYFIKYLYLYINHDWSFFIIFDFFTLILFFNIKKKRFIKF